MNANKNATLAAVRTLSAQLDTLLAEERRARTLANVADLADELDYLLSVRL